MNKLISTELSDLVSWSVAILGKAIKKEYGEETYSEIEKLRKKMKTIRSATDEKVYSTLSAELRHFQTFSDIKVHQLCNSYSLMLELINRCETAYRAYRLEDNEFKVPKQIPRKIIFVLTAHPTEARSPEVLGLFENIQALLVKALKSDIVEVEDEIYHLLHLTLKVALARKTNPTVEDEAHNIYSYILKDEILDSLVKFSKKNIDVSFRSWVGGDKDGHPGVNEKTLVKSLSMSRQYISSYIERKLQDTIKYIRFIHNEENIKLLTSLKMLVKEMSLLNKVQNFDGERVAGFRRSFKEVFDLYLKTIKVQSPNLDAINRLLWIFPALVVALEIREDSALVKEAIADKKDFAITKMLLTLKSIATGFDKKWYVRGFVLSMVEETSDIENGIKLTIKTLGAYEIPVVPLFENEKALTSAVPILEELFKRNKAIIPIHEKLWGSRYEVMVGYSDSSKENGVLPSRIMISSALKNIEKVLKSHKLTPIFFHGSGGSIERGGGALSEQTGWWPKSAIETFKATIQGEMVARSFGSEFILAKQVQTISNQLGKFTGKQKVHSALLKKFTNNVRLKYSEKIQDEKFLDIIEGATPYSFLHHLKIGSRPSKRAGGSIKNNLRAIPWILCWTQTRTLFPTWWGVGTAWENLSKIEKIALKQEYKNNSVLISYVKALGFTLAKVELGIWKLYLENSKLEPVIKNEIYLEFKTELDLSKKFFQEISGKKELLWFRPWLKESVELRSAMIHPLNLCQLESLRRKDHQLLRNSVTGIACGMLTTG